MHHQVLLQTWTPLGRGFDGWEVKQAEESITGWKHLQWSEEDETNKCMAKWRVKNEHSELQEPSGWRDGEQEMRHLLGEKHCFAGHGVWRPGLEWRDSVSEPQGGWSTRP